MIALKGSFGPAIKYKHKSRFSFATCDACKRLCEKTYLTKFSNGQYICKWCVMKVGKHE